MLYDLNFKVFISMCVFSSYVMHTIWHNSFTTGLKFEITVSPFGLVCQWKIAMEL